MATKFGYVERNLENDVNWAEVGKGFSDLLLAERDERRAKKKNLDDVMYSAQESFRKEAPIGYNTTFNDQTMSLVSQSTAIVKAWNTDMKAGNISPEEYMRKMQSMNDSVDTFFALGNNYNKFYENKLNRMDKGISGNVEGASFQAITDLLDFNKMGITFDVDGHIIAAPLVKGEDGVTSMDTDNARSIQAVFNLAQNDVDTIDVLSTIQDKVKLMGTDIVGTDVAATYGKEGMKKVLTGLKLTDPDTYNEYKATALNSMLVNPFHVAAILSDFTDKYETTTDRKKWEANKDKYLLVDIEDGKEVIMGEFTEKQKEDARDILDKAWEGQVGTSSVETATSKNEKSFAEKKFWWTNNQNKIKNKTMMSQLAILYGGREEDMKPAIAYFKGLNENLHDIERSSTGTTAIFRDPTTNKLVRGATTPFGSSFDIYAKSATSLTGLKNANEALKSLDLKNVELDNNGDVIFQEYKGKTFQNPDKNLESGDSYTQYSAHLNNKIKPGSSEAAITSALAGTGYEVKGGKLMKDGKAVGTRTYDLSNSQDIEDLKTEVLSDKTAAASYLTAKKIKGNPTEGMTTAEIIEFYTQD